MTALRVALGEYDTGWHQPEESLERAAALTRRAAAAGARLVVLPEMATTGFTMDTAQAELLAGSSVRGLAEIAAGQGVHLLAGVALREPELGGSSATNAAVLLDPRGGVAALYRKQRLFAFAGEHEHYAPGTEPAVATVEGVRISPFVCYDLRFPELFRAVARQVDAIVLIANWPASRRAHWDVLVRARAIENQCYVVAVNRTGVAGGLTYDGGSVAYDPWGEPLSPAASPDDGPACVDLDPCRVREVREKFPFLEDLAPLAQR